jgi:flagellar biosynthesis protein FliP
MSFREKPGPILAGLFFLGLLLVPALSQAAAVPIPKLELGVTAAKNPREVATSLQILFLLTILTLAPALLILTTSFTRIVVVLSFLRQAMGTQQIPSNQVMLGLSLFLTFYTMSPVFTRMNQEAIQPYMANHLEQGPALEKALEPLRELVFRHTREKDLALFIYYSKTARPRTPVDVPTLVLIPAYVLSELKTGFEMGFIIYIPFLIIDMVVASTLMSMGMLMLPPVTISLPFKILLFILIDGWNLIVRSLVSSFV